MTMFSHFRPTRQAPAKPPAISPPGPPLHSLSPPHALSLPATRMPFPCPPFLARCLSLFPSLSLRILQKPTHNSKTGSVPKAYQPAPAACSVPAALRFPFSVPAALLFPFSVPTACSVPNDKLSVPARDPHTLSLRIPINRTANPTGSVPAAHLPAHLHSLSLPRPAAGSVPRP
jgi:hypothetical protein